MTITLLLFLLGTFSNFGNPQLYPTYIPKTINGEVCSMPFEYRGTLYNDCITAGMDKPWCSLDKVYVSGRSKWGYCVPRESSSVPIYIPKTVAGDFCAIPFVYKDITYHDCVPLGNRFWCSLDKIYVDGQSKWDFCIPKPKELEGCLFETPNVTMTEVTEILKEHNTIRAQISAKNMRKIEWNSELAQKAQAAANKCSFKHDEKMLCAGRFEAGQNLYYNYWDQNYPAQLTWSKVINFWYREGNDYNIDTTSCAEGKLCEHYTQIVWSNTGQIGCGKAYCYGPMYGDLKNLQYSIQYYCNYFEGGNVHGVAPYTLSKDDRCKNCFTLDAKRKFKCDSDQLCEACQNDANGCIGLVDLKLMSDKGMICVDTSPFCEANKGICNLSKSGAFLPPPVKELIDNCNKTCNRC